MRQMIIDKLILETDGGLNPKKKEKLQEKYNSFTDEQLVDELYSHGWQNGYEDGYQSGADGT